MATNPIGDSKTTTISLPKEMHRKTVPRWKKMGVRSFSAYVQRLIADDLEKRGKLTIVDEQPRVDADDAKHKYIPPREPRVKRQ